MWSGKTWFYLEEEKGNRLVKVVGGRYFSTFASPCVTARKVRHLLMSVCVCPVLEEGYLVNLTILLDIDLPYQIKVKKEQLLACLGYSVAFIGSGWGQRVSAPSGAFGVCCFCMGSAALLSAVTNLKKTKV